MFVINDMVKEDQYYEGLRETYLEDQLYCFASGVSKGLRYGILDVVGVRDTGGKSSGDVELIGIEVKLDKASYLKSIGQAKGYTLYSN